MESKWLMVVALALMVGCEKPASDGTAAVKVLSPLEQVMELSNSFSSDQEKWMASMRAAKPAERAELMKTRPDAAAVAAKIKALADREKDPEVRFESLMFSAKNMRDEAASIELVKDHSTNDKVAQVVMMLARSSNPDVKSALESLATAEGNSPAKGAALFSLAMQLEEDDPATAEQYLEKIAADFAAVDIGGRKLGDLAAPMLFAIKNLGIGKVAPDIEGEDLDSVAFKLSDYRGKVVVLDFWGDW